MQEILKVLKRDRLIHIVIIGTLVYTLALSTIYNISFNLSLKRFTGDVMLVEGLTLAGLLCVFIYRMWRAGNKSPTLTIIRTCRDLVKRPAELIAFLLVNLAILIFISGFSFIKSMIPAINPFAYDTLFASLDQSLHFGFAPWEITHAVFSSPIATAVINFFYNLWFFLFWVVVFIFALRVKSPEDRQQYLVSYFLCWLIIGGVCATFLSSVGPIFYAKAVAGPDPYAPLMETLRTQHTWLVDNGSPVSVWALGVADMLWERYANSETGFGSGISAMPSMHVSMAVLMALGMSRVSKLWGRIFWVYALIIQIGSVHLAWHYAIDGYFSIIATILIWHGVGKLVIARQRRLQVIELAITPAHESP